MDDPEWTYSGERQRLVQMKHTFGEPLLRGIHGVTLILVDTKSDKSLREKWPIIA